MNFDNANRALVVWQRFDGAKIRVQGTIREAGAGGAFQNEATLSDPGEDALRPQSAAGQNVDANGVIVGIAPTVRTCECRPLAAATTSGTYDRLGLRAAVLTCARVRRVQRRRQPRARAAAGVRLVQPAAEELDCC